MPPGQQPACTHWAFVNANRVPKKPPHAHLATATADDGLGARPPALLSQPLNLRHAALAIEFYHTVLIASRWQGSLPGGSQQPVGGLTVGREGRGGVREDAGYNQRQQRL